MKTYQRQRIHGPLYRTRSDNGSNFTFSERGIVLTLLAMPMAITLIAIILAAITTAMGEMAKESIRFYIAAYAYTFLMSSLMGLPAYVAAYGWFWWSTKRTDSNLIKSIWWLPLHAVAFVWFPALILPQVAQIGRGKVYVFLAAITLVFGYTWVAIVRFILRFWRKI